ncbi:hypothetical protein EDC01DRAFT_509064 [Geopyxis carbonaria]|nr:hypothetical protein EDC01DRAFT_509064 [Geopyxis carbonaria]
MGLRRCFEKDDPKSWVWPPRRGVLLACAALTGGLIFVHDDSWPVGFLVGLGCCGVGIVTTQVYRLTMDWGSIQHALHTSYCTRGSRESQAKVFGGARRPISEHTARPAVFRYSLFPQSSGAALSLDPTPFTRYSL